MAGKITWEWESRTQRSWGRQAAFSQSAEDLGITAPLQVLQGCRIGEELPKPMCVFFLQGRSPILMMVYTTDSSDTWGTARQFGDPQSEPSL